MKCPEMCGLRDTVLAMVRGSNARWQELREWLEEDAQFLARDAYPAGTVLRVVLAKMDELEREQGGGE